MTKRLYARALLHDSTCVMALVGLATIARREGDVRAAQRLYERIMETEGRVRAPEKPARIGGQGWAARALEGGGGGGGGGGEGQKQGGELDDDGPGPLFDMDAMAARAQSRASMMSRGAAGGTPRGVLLFSGDPGFDRGDSRGRTPQTPGSGYGSRYFSRVRRESVGGISSGNIGDLL